MSTDEPRFSPVSALPGMWKTTYHSSPLDASLIAFQFSECNH